MNVLIFSGRRLLLWSITVLQSSYN